MVDTPRLSNAVYCTGWCSAFGFVGPYWSQLHEATMSGARVCCMRLGMEVGQLVAVVSPNPPMVWVDRVASPVAWSDAVVPQQASCMTESPRIMTRSGLAGDGAGVSSMGSWPA